MQILIKTKYISATDTAGAKIRATFANRTKSIPYSALSAINKAEGNTL